jgi:hypothetical protein
VDLLTRSSRGAAALDTALAFLDRDFMRGQLLGSGSNASAAGGTVHAAVLSPAEQQQQELDLSVPALRAIKRSIGAADELPAAEALAVEAEAFAQVWAAPSSRVANALSDQIKHR